MFVTLKLPIINYSETDIGSCEPMDLCKYGCTNVHPISGLSRR